MQVKLPDGYHWDKCPQCYEKYGYSLYHEKCGNASCTGGGCDECCGEDGPFINTHLKFKAPEEIRYKGYKEDD